MSIIVFACTYLAFLFSTCRKDLFAGHSYFLLQSTVTLQRFILSLPHTIDWLSIYGSILSYVCDQKNKILKHQSNLNWTLNFFYNIRRFIRDSNWCSIINFWASKAKNEFCFCKEKQNSFFSFYSFCSIKIGSRS